MPLTDHQVEKKAEILRLIREEKQTRVILQGAAGVGKTFLVSELVKDLKRDYGINPNYNNGLMYVTAPTNKALAVLQGKISTSVEFKTIHSALKMVRVTDNKTGERKFVQSYHKSKDDDFKDCKVCVIDEASMISGEILGFLGAYQFPIIFVGDRYQINPVGELNTPVFNTTYPVVELTEIIRQGPGNPIIELSRDIDMLYFKQPDIRDSKGYTYSDNKGQIIEDLAEVNGTDDMKYLTWTNVDVDQMNQSVRERRYGKPRRIEKEETIVFNTPMEANYTNKEVKVIDVDVVIDYIPIPKYTTRYDGSNTPLNATDFIKMKFYRINNSFNVLHEDSDGTYKDIKTTLKYNCSKLGWGWKGYFNFIENQFADIKYNHAISVHKSQGSTYKTTVINIGNINFNKSAEEKQRLLYTAITRASDLVILNNVK